MKSAIISKSDNFKIYGLKENEWEAFERNVKYDAFLAKHKKIIAMKKIEDLNKKKVPIVRIDNSLEKFKDLPIFQDKVDKANEMLKNVGLPKDRSTTDAG